MQRRPTCEANSRPGCPEENPFFRRGVDRSRYWTLYVAGCVKDSKVYS
jgi:hypothetical protein